MWKTMWQAVFVWRVPPTSLDGAQAILSHAAGENSPTDPGIVNQYLAEVVRKLHHEFHVPVIVQGELAPCLCGIPLYAVSPRQREIAPKYLSTFAVTKWMKQECQRLGATRVILVSYYPHYWRGYMAAQKHDLIVLVPEGLKEIYEPRNSQIWARYKWFNRAYELFIARPYSILRGWV